jgi:lysophospholipase L1-like esterase
MRLLFQGDSVTDCGRDRTDIHHLGGGYPRFAAPLLRVRFPQVDWEFINQGCSGDRTSDLLVRWQTDCIELQPDMVSIMIGINDTWRAFDNNDPMPVEEFESNYRRLLEDIKQHTTAKIIMMEPFLLHNDPVQYTWRTDLNAKIDTVRRLATELADVYIPLDALFAVTSAKQQTSHWTVDGVHPTDAGSQLIAAAFLEGVAKLI